jgi:selenophosphate synthase
LSKSTPKKRLKSRWEPVPEEKVTEKVEPVAKTLMNGSAHHNFEAKNTTVRTGMLLFLKSCCQAFNIDDGLSFWQ